MKRLLELPRERRQWRDYFLLSLTYYLCRRVGEAVCLQTSHFQNLESGEVLVPILKRVRKGKFPAGMLRDAATGLPLLSVPVIDGLSVMRAAVNWARGREWLFEGRRSGTHMSVKAAERAFMKWAALVEGMPHRASMHSLRHTACSRVVEAAGVAAGRDLAGHANIATTDRYAHTTKEALARARGSLTPR